MPVESRDKFIFARVREPDQFKEGTFRFKWFNQSRGIAAVVGILRSTGKSAIQAMRFLKARGWNVDKVKAWMASHRDQLSKEVDDMVRTVTFSELSDIFAKWTRKYINDLPDAAFAAILPGGKKDDDGKTVPRDLRMLPHHDASVKDPDEKASLDMPHLRNAMARLPQADMEKAMKLKAAKHLKHHADQMDMDTKAMDDMMKEMMSDDSPKPNEQAVQETASPPQTEVLSHSLVLRIASDTLGFKPVDGVGFVDTAETARMYSAFCHGEGADKHTDLFIQDGNDAVHYVLTADGAATGGARVSSGWLRTDSVVTVASGTKISMALRGRGRCSTGVFTKAGGELFMEGRPYSGRYAIADGKFVHAETDVPHILDAIIRGGDPSVPPDGVSFLPTALKAKVPENMRYWDAKTGKTAKLVLCSEWYKNGGYKVSLPGQKVRLAIDKFEKIETLSLAKPKLRVFGTIIRTGEFNELEFTADVLEEAAPRFKGLPIMLEHRFDASEIVGQVVSTIWNHVRQSVDFVGEIDDEATAIAISRGTLHDVSMGTFVDYVLRANTPDGKQDIPVNDRIQAADKIFALYDKYGKDNVSVKLAAANLRPREVSLVMEGACSYMDGCGILSSETSQ